MASYGPTSFSESNALLEELLWATGRLHDMISAELGERG